MSRILRNADFAQLRHVPAVVRVPLEFPLPHDPTDPDNFFHIDVDATYADMVIFIPWLTFQPSPILPDTYLSMTMLNASPGQLIHVYNPNPQHVTIFPGHVRAAPVSMTTLMYDDQNIVVDKDGNVIEPDEPRFAVLSTFCPTGTTFNIDEIQTDGDFAIIVGHTGESTWRFRTDGTLVLDHFNCQILAANALLLSAGFFSPITWRLEQNGELICPGPVIVPAGEGVESDGDVVVVANRSGVAPRTWTFNTAGGLTTAGGIAVPDAARLGTANNDIQFNPTNIVWGTNRTSGPAHEWAFAIDGNVYVLSPADPGLISVRSGYHLTTNGVPLVGSQQRWYFDTAGLLTAPGSVAVPNSSGLQSTGALTLVTDSAGSAGEWTFDTDGSMYMAGHVNLPGSAEIRGSDALALVADSGGTPRSWTFDTAGLLTTPGSVAVPTNSGLSSVGNVRLTADTGGTPKLWSWRSDGHMEVSGASTTDLLLNPATNAMFRIVNNTPSGSGGTHIINEIRGASTATLQRFSLVTGSTNLWNVGFTASDGHFKIGEGNNVLASSIRMTINSSTGNTTVGGTLTTGGNLTLPASATISSASGDLNIATSGRTWTFRSAGNIGLSGQNAGFFRATGSIRISENDAGVIEHLTGSGNVHIDATNNGALTDFRFRNLGTGVASVRNLFTIGSASTGNVWVCLTQETVGDGWSIGRNNGQSNRLEFCNGNQLGSNIRMHLTTAGVLTLPNLANGTLSSVGGVITSSSDERLKDNIADLDGEIIYDFKPKTWQWREDNPKGISPFVREPGEETDPETRKRSKVFVDTKEKFTSTGFIAQDYEKIIPGAVCRDLDGYCSLDYFAIMAHMARSIKALHERVSELEAKLGGT